MKRKKFKILNDQLCISVEAIVEVLGEKMKKTIYKGIERYKNNQSSSYAYYEDPNNARFRYIIYSSLPEKTQNNILMHFSDPMHYYYMERFVEALPGYINDEDINYFYDIIRNTDIRLSSSRIDDLVRACGWLRMLSDRYMFDKFYYLKKPYLIQAARIIKEQNIYNLSISHWRSLDRKIAAWQAGGRQSLLPRKAGNTNAKKITDIGYKFLINIYASPLKPTIRDTWRQYNIQAEQRGWRQISEERVRQLINLPASRQIWMLGRDGSTATRNALERTIKRRRPSFPDALWSLDGLTVQLRYMEDGQVRSDLYAVIIMDVYSDNIVGHAIGTHETSTLVQAALRSAGRNTMYMPYQLQYDNSSANLSKEVSELMPRLAHFNFPTSPYNGKSKPVENLIGRLERFNLRHFPNFKGGNITSPSLSIKANPDFLEAQRKNKTLPSKQQAMAQFKLAILTHNNTKGSDGLTPIERYAKPHPKRRRMDVLTMVNAYWVTRRHKARYTKNGLTIEVDKKRYTYEVEASKGVEDMQFRTQWLGHKFTIKYDPDDLDQIHLYDGDTWIAMAVQKYEAPMALADREEGDGSIISDALDQRRQYINNMARQIREIQDQLEDEGLPVDLDHNILHKDAYNRMESDALDRIIRQTAAKNSLYNTKPNTIIDLYPDEEADGSIVE